MGKKRKPQHKKSKADKSEISDVKEAKNFDQLDAHGVQEALKEELKAEDVTCVEDGVEDGVEPDDNEVIGLESNKTPSDDLNAGEEGGTDIEIEDIDPDAGQGVDEDDILVWTAVQMAEHVRMAEALLFAAVEPLDENSISERLPQGADIPAILETLKAQYDNRGVNLAKIAKKWRFVTAPDVAPILEKEKIEQRKLSRAALETLAIIAYHQPCTRADIEDVRGVAVSRGSLDQLMEIGWVRLRGRRKNVPGRPVLYGTSQPFMEHFGLESLGDLPGMADLKAAGLLDARLPPNFQIPTPRDSEEGVGEELDGEMETEFAQDFMGEGDLAEINGDLEEASPSNNVEH